jgi:hypothetical protein
MGNREENLGRRILFTVEDFEPLFQAEGIDFLTLDEPEWRAFENMFMEGTGWSDVVKEAAWNIQQERARQDFLGAE